MNRMKRTRGTGSLKLRGKTWWIVYSHRGRPYAESSGSTDINAAKKLLAKRLGEIASGQFPGPTPEKVTIGDLADLMIADYKHTQKRSLDDVGYRTRLHIRPPLGNVKAARFGNAQLQKDVAARRQQGAENSTIPVAALLPDIPREIRPPIGEHLGAGSAPAKRLDLRDYTSTISGAARFATWSGLASRAKSPWEAAVTRRSPFPLGTTSSARGI